MRYLFLLVALTGSFSCIRSSDVAPANALVGTWRLTTYCKPVNATACTTVNVPADKGVFIRFTNGGQYSEFYENTKPVEYAFLGCGGGSYQIEGDSVRIRAIGMSSSNGNLYRIVSARDDKLIINPFGTGEYLFEKEQE